MPIILKSHHAGQEHVSAKSLSTDCELDPWLSDKFFSTDILSHPDDHLCQIIYKSCHAGRSDGQETIRENYICGHNSIFPVII